MKCPNRWWTLQTSSKMQLTGCPRAPWLLWMVEGQSLSLCWLTKTTHSQFTIVNLCTRCLSSIDDGSFNVSKDAVDRLFQNIVKALNGSNDIPWGFFAFIWHLILRCNCQQTCTLSCLPQMDEGSFKWLQRWLWRAVPGCYGSSQWFKWHALMLSCL